MSDKPNCVICEKPEYFGVSGGSLVRCIFCKKPMHEDCLFLSGFTTDDIHALEPKCYDCGKEKPPVRIALGSKARVGKDQTADYFQDRRLFRRLSFAQDLYKCCDSIQTILGKNVEKDRLLLRTIGQGLKDVYGPNVWVETVEKKIQQCILLNENIIITDLRFKEEWDMLKKYGFTTIRVERDQKENAGLHISEVDLDEKEWDLTIKNNGTLLDLQQRVVDILNFL